MESCKERGGRLFIVRAAYCHDPDVVVSTFIPYEAEYTRAESNSPKIPPLPAFGNTVPNSISDWQKEIGDHLRFMLKRVRTSGETFLVFKPLLFNVP